jgi:hypothetical protein
VVDVRVDREVDPAPRGGPGDPLQPLHDVGLQPVLGQSHQRLGGQPDVADRLDVEQPHEERFEVLPRDVGDVATGDHDVAYTGVLAQVSDHRVVPVDRLEGELELVDRRRRVADEVHPCAVAAVLRAGGQQLGEDLGGVPVGQPFGDPHVVLVERVAGGVRVRRPHRVPVGGHGDHVPPDRVGVERGRVRNPVGDHRVEHLRRYEHRHRGQRALVGREVGVELLADQVAEDVMQLPGVLHAVGALPLRRLPLLAGHVAPAREAGPVRLDQLPPPVLVRLHLGHVASGNSCSFLGTLLEILS